MLLAASITNARFSAQATRGIHHRRLNMNPTSMLFLEFHPERDDLGKGKSLRDGLSVALQVGDTLWVANDETISLERLTLVDEGGTGQYGHGKHHKQFSLA